MFQMEAVRTQPAQSGGMPLTGEGPTGRPLSRLRPPSHRDRPSPAPGGRIDTYFHGNFFKIYSIFL
jgi:hypothetical protein